MFNFFKKKPKTNQFSENKFLNSFNDDQKGAIFYTLFLVASIKSSSYNSKMNYIINQYEVLNFNLDNPVMSVYQAKKADYAYSIINKFSDSQKGWYSIVLGTILLVNGTKPEDDEITLVYHIASQCGISKDEFDRNNKNAQQFMNSIVK
jgi:hypothetical protein